jgi:hypothetical protein
MLLMVDLYKNFLDGKSVAVGSMFLLQSSDVYSAEFDVSEMS